ncbi:hypothetical protein O181_029510 [Austropuccinia psidii MF-1]|uniref:Dipeptidyl-aminopeptidase B n=1 Tax=Austropuccinia psidii MF-1 TaxID=1389203 RepID=A0A9Q3CUK3_9BASI|nr:hypothetical protein [Austropuccinia psidii MF-1]
MAHPPVVCGACSALEALFWGHSALSVDFLQDCVPNTWLKELGLKTGSKSVSNLHRHQESSSSSRIFIVIKNLHRHQESSSSSRIFIVIKNLHRHQEFNQGGRHPQLKMDYNPTKNSSNQSKINPELSHKKSFHDISESEIEDDEDFIINKTFSISSSTKPLLPITASTSPPTNNINLLKKINKKFRSFKFIVLCSSSLILLFLISFLLSSSKLKHDFISNSFQVDKKIPLNDIFNGKFSVDRHSIDWLKEAGDGVYYEINLDGIILFDLKTNSTQTLVTSDQLVEPNGNSIHPTSFTVSSDLRYILITSDFRKQWRYSGLSNYWIYDNHSKTLTSLTPQIPSNIPAVSLAKWSPTGHSIVYVFHNDIYLIQSPDQVYSPIRLTNTGTPTIFNGICDWVYEEEVFSSSQAIWWSPDSKKIIWLSLDESKVPTYDLTVYNPTPSTYQINPYPHDLKMKYPKPGYSNPIVSVWVFDLEKYQTTGGSVDQSINELKLKDAFEDEDRIVMEVAWVTDHELILREINRIATREKTGYFDFKSISPPDSMSSVLTGKVVMDIDFVKYDGGWAEPGQFITPINPLDTLHDYAPGYLDVRINSAGFRHIAYFSPPDSNQPVFLTDGQWEVGEAGVAAVDLQKQLVYFVAANPSMERHLYSVQLPNKSQLSKLKTQQQSIPTPTALTSGIGYYSVDFSNLAGFYLLSYQGPKIPWQKLVKVDDPEYNHMLADNQFLNQTLSKFDLPTVHHTSIKNSLQQDMNIKEIRPHNMDLSGKTKYPVLFRVYGGPNSQVASAQFTIDWSYFLASKLNYLIVHVDGRGTGFKGREFRVGVRNQLGKLEATDVSFAARYYAGLKYVDQDRIGVWGWSYGGYLTCKIVESYSKDFSMALAVAPVIDWRFYDTVYTERYMSTPQLNPDGYNQSAVRKTEGFGNLSFSLAHGSADDNVHFMNSAQLLDQLTSTHIHGFQFRLFSDSDHSIATRGAHPELFRWMTDFLISRWGHGLLKGSSSYLPGSSEIDYYS